MIQGTGSDVGKSLVVAGLARAFVQSRATRRAVQAAEHVQQRRGDGGRRRDRPRPGAAGARRAPRADRRYESRAAEAARRRRRADRGARQGGRRRPRARISGVEAAPDVRSCWRATSGLRGAADIVLVEGAGSAAEINLRANDIANMGFARASTRRSCSSAISIAAASSRSSSAARRCSMRMTRR